MKILIQYCRQCGHNHLPGQHTRTSAPPPLKPKVQRINVSKAFPPGMKRDTKGFEAANQRLAKSFQEVKDGVALTSIVHPGTDINPDAIEEIEIDVFSVVLTKAGDKLWRRLTDADRAAFRNGEMFKRLLDKRAKARETMKRLRSVGIKPVEEKSDGEDKDAG